MQIPSLNKLTRKNLFTFINRWYIFPPIKLSILLLKKLFDSLEKGTVGQFLKRVNVSYLLSNQMILQTSERIVYGTFVKHLKLIPILMSSCSTSSFCVKICPWNTTFNLMYGALAKQNYCPRSTKEYRFIRVEYIYKSMTDKRKTNSTLSAP